MKHEILITRLAKNLLPLFFFGAFSPAIQAAHIIGGEITYQCLGFTNNDPNTQSRTYLFNMKIYRDCQGNGANFDGAPGGAFDTHITIYRASSSNPVFVYILDPPVVQFVDPNPGNACVVIPPNVCVQRGEYEFPFIDLPIINESYYITYQRCCRNNTITNIVNPGGSGATYTMELTAAAQAVGNSSPTFNAFPPAVLCAGQPFSINHTATDIDGDQLVYELCTPLLGGGMSTANGSANFNGLAPNPDAPPPYNGVNFQAPNFTALNPLGAAAGVSIGTNTGILTGEPMLGGQFVVGVCVSEYRNGVLLSTVRRDFQFNVTTCQITVAAGIQAELQNGVYLYNSCGEQTLNFVNQSMQPQNINSFRWEFDTDEPTTIINTWNATMTFPGTGSYEGRLLLNPGEDCSDTAFIKVNIFPGITADFESDYDTCKAGLVDFKDLSLSGAGQIVEWNWTFGDGKTSASQNPQHPYREPGQRVIGLQVEDVDGCRDTVEKFLNYFPVPGLILISPNRVEDCAPAEISFNNLSSPIDERYEVVWDFGDGGSSEEISPAHVYEQDGLFDVSLSITSPIGCQTDTVFQDLIRVLPGPVADFEFSPESPDAFDPVVTFTDQSSGAWRWNWNFDGLHTSIEQNPAYVFQDTGSYKVVLTVTHPNGCQDTTSRYIDIVPKITFQMPNAFTPNDDSVNDVFKGEGFLRGVEAFTLKIWSRWGEMVFESDDPDLGWNGRVGSQQAPSGIYLYEVYMNHPRGERLFYKGFVTLVR